MKVIRFPHTLCCLMLMTLCVSVAASAASQQWQSVTLADKKIGHRHITREAGPGRLITRELLQLHTRVPGEKSKKSQTIIETFETSEGKPISVRKTLVTSHGEHLMTAVVKGRYLVTGIEGQRGGRQKIKLPDDFLLREGVRLKLMGLPGSKGSLIYSAWSFAKQRFEKTQLDVVSAADIPGVKWKITRSVVGEVGRKTIIHADAEFYFISEYSQSGGDELAVVTCDKACATGNVKPLENVYRQLIRSPYRIPDSALRGKVRYSLSMPSSLKVPTTGEQKIEILDEELRVTVCRDCGTAAQADSRTLENALKPNYWMDYKNAEFTGVMNKVLGGGVLEPVIKMKRLTRFVTRHMKTGEIVYSGYSTAAQALASATGDCTEHALLLAALGRAANIPTRVVFGLVYSNERFYGKNYVFVPHAWVQAWVGEKWVSYDSGMEGFTSGHIALGISNGEQADFLRISEKLHDLKIISAAQLK